MPAVLNISAKELALYSEQVEFACAIREKASFTSELIDLLENQGQGVAGAKLPWSATHTSVGFRPQELSVWAGYSYQGKSLLLGQIAMEFARQGQKTLICSLEMPPKMTLLRLLRQATLKPNPESEDARRFAHFLPDHLFLYDFVGTTTVQKVLQIIAYCRHHLQIDHIVLDSLSKIVAGEDDYSAQKDFINQLADLARSLKVHIHLVHHLRKPSSDNHEPNKFDLRGSTSLSDLADNIFVLFKRSKAKDAISAMSPKAPFAIVNDNLSDGDYVLQVEKQRHGEFSGRIKLWFNPVSLRFTKPEDANSSYL